MFHESLDTVHTIGSRGGGYDPRCYWQLDFDHLHLLEADLILSRGQRRFDKVWYDPDLRRTGLRSRLGPRLCGGGQARACPAPHCHPSSSSCITRNARQNQVEMPLAFFQAALTCIIRSSCLRALHLAFFPAQTRILVGVERLRKHRPMTMFSAAPERCRLTPGFH